MKTNILKCSFCVTSGKFLGFTVNARGIEINPEKIQAIWDIQVPRTIKQVQSLNEKVAVLSRFISRAMEKFIHFFDVIKKGNINFEWKFDCMKAFRALVRHLESPPCYQNQLTMKCYMYTWLYPSMLSVRLWFARRTELKSRCTM